MPPHRPHRIPLVLGLVSSLLAVLALAPSACRAQQPATARLRSLVVGVYTLAEWHTAAAVLRPPQVSGRFIILDGTITTILHGPAEAGSTTTNALVGTYTLEKARFAYGYDDVTNVTEAAAGASVSHTHRWQGTRSFSVRVEDGSVVMRTEDGRAQFLFTAAGMTYSEAGRTVRVWKRVAAPP